MAWDVIIQASILGILIAVSGIMIGMFIVVSNQHLSSGAANKLMSFKPLFMRRREIFRVANRIRTGQSSAIVGLFSEEKSEILRYLNNQDPLQRQQLYGDKADVLLFSYIDMAMDLSEQDTPAKFWETALSGIYRSVRIDSDIGRAYRFCVDTQFQKAELEDFLMALLRERKQLVLLVDQFEKVLDYSEFKNNWEFFTTLRRLATLQNPSLLTLVIASNLSLLRLHEEIQQNQKTSPVLNFIEVTPIVGLFEAEADKLLKEEAPQLSVSQRNFVKDMTGGHPYLIKIITTHLAGETTNSSEQLEAIVCGKARDSLKLILGSWSPTTRQVLRQIKNQDHLPGFEKELNELAEQGIIVKKSNRWQIKVQIFEKCLDDIDFEP